ncbi:MAG TPA: FKBP-type peptidyl-prolyl cis-trans isomerase [Solirubrobacterales bacterium]|nr:FKBP-type peptidyl-prolyl cis-trans isomerase [Solirubrobacterales bacterium]
MPQMRRLVLIITALVALVAAGCGSGGDGSSSASSDSFKPFRIPTPGGKSPIRYEEKQHLDASGLSGPEPKPVIPKGPPPEFVALNDLIEGIGHLYERGEKLTVQYVGYDYETGKKFASSWEEEKPFTFTLGKGEVIEGWEEGLEGLEGGDRREMVIPADEARGKLPPGIPQGKAVIFVVEPTPVFAAKAAKAAKEEAAAEKAKHHSKAKSPPKTKPTVAVPSGPPPKKLEIKDLKKGEGPAAKAGDKVTVQYVGVDYKTGKQFDASWDRGEPFSFTLGAGEVIKGWDQGIGGMKAGGRRELIVPPGLAYGSQQVGSIPPNSTLVFVVDLLEIN